MPRRAQGKSKAVGRGWQPAPGLFSWGLSDVPFSKATAKPQRLLSCSSSWPLPCSFFSAFLQDTGYKVSMGLQRSTKTAEHGPRALLLSSCCAFLGSEISPELACNCLIRRPDHVPSLICSALISPLYFRLEALRSCLPALPGPSRPLQCRAA